MISLDQAIHLCLFVIYKPLWPIILSFQQANYSSFVDWLFFKQICENSKKAKHVSIGTMTWQVEIFYCARIGTLALTILYKGGVLSFL